MIGICARSAFCADVFWRFFMTLFSFLHIIDKVLYLVDVVQMETVYHC